MRFRTLVIIWLAATCLYAQNDKRTIGLIPVENSAGSTQYEWISFGLEYLLSNKLAVISGFYLPPREVMQEALDEAGYTSGQKSERIIYHLGKSANVEVIINGSYKVSGNILNLDVNYYNSFNGSKILTDTYTEEISGLFDISTRIVRRLVELAGITLSSTEQRIINATFTNSISAFESFVKAYMEDAAGRGRSEVVIGLFRKAIREDPKFWEAYYNLGIVYFNNRNYDQALDQFDKVITALPNFDKPYHGRGLIYERQKKYEQAIADFKKVTELNPNDYKPYYQLGKISIDKEEYTKAEEYLDKAQELNPEFAPLFFEIGNIYFNQNIFRKAIDPYRKATELDNENTKYHLRLGETYYRSQIYYNAYNEFQAVLSREPADPIANFMLGVTVYKQAVLEELIEAFLDLLSEETEVEQTSGNGSRKFKKQRAIDPIKRRAVYDQMVDAFTKASQARSNFMEATFNLALTYFEMGSYELAEKYFKATLQINPDLIRAYMKLAEVYEETGRLEDAIEQYRKVFQIEPGLIVRQPTLGEVHQYINILDRFIKEVNDKLELNPNDPRNNLVLAKVFQAQGHFGKSANLLRKVLKINPGNREAKQLLARLEEYNN